MSWTDKRLDITFGEKNEAEMITVITKTVYCIVK